MINPLRSEREAFRFLLYVVAVAVAIVAVVLVARAVASPGAQTTLQTGRMQNGTWEMLGERRKVAGRPGVCIDLVATFEDGSTPGRSTSCGWGPTRRGVWHFSGSSIRGGETASYLVGGVVTSRARTVRYTFADGETLRLRTWRPPRGFRRLRGIAVRMFAGDALAVTRARITRVRAYDGRGRKVGDSRNG